MVDTGSFDFKTSEARQLHAYAYALEHPAPKATTLRPINRLGLFIVEPVRMEITSGGQITYLVDVTWMEIPKDDSGFLAFLESVLTVLENPQPPECHPDCKFCQYRETPRGKNI